MIGCCLSERVCLTMPPQSQSMRPNTTPVRYPETFTQNISYRARSTLMKGWSGGAMVLGKLPVLGRPTVWITVGRGPTALAVGASGVVWTFLFSSILCLLFLPLFGRRPDID